MVIDIVIVIIIIIVIVIAIIIILTSQQDGLHHSHQSWSSEAQILSLWGNLTPGTGRARLQPEFCISEGQACSPRNSAFADFFLVLVLFSAFTFYLTNFMSTCTSVPVGILWQGNLSVVQPHLQGLQSLLSPILLIGLPIDHPGCWITCTYFTTDKKNLLYLPIADLAKMYGSMWGRELKSPARITAASFSSTFSNSLGKSICIFIYRTFLNIFLVPECQGYMKGGDIQLSEILPNCVDVSHLEISWILKCLSLQWWCVEILQIFTSSLLKVKKSGFLTVSFFPVDLCFSWMTKRTWSLKKT